MATPFSSTSTPIILLSLLFFCLLPTSFSQPSPCNGVLITYHYQTGNEIPPILLPGDPVNQPYRFQSTLTVRNNGRDELKNWRVFVGFKHGELLVSAKNAVLANGTSLPANVSGGAVFAGSSVTDLKTAIQTAGDIEQMQTVVELVGTQFGVGGPDVPLPDTLALANDGFLCPNPTTQGNDTTVCCNPDPNAKTNITAVGDFSPLQPGDVTIMYDVVMTYENNYWAQVTISNHNPFGRLQNWNLSWDWMGGEFIYSMRGAYPKVVDTGDCIFGNQGQYYKDPFDFSKALSCESRPTIVDLPLSKTNDTNIGMVPFCCRDGIILPPAMDSTKSKSSFQMQVYKMPPNLNKTELAPPQNWKINSTIGPDYQCQQPVRVSPTLFPNPSGLPSHTAAIASWQVVCNTTRNETKKPTCCVSFSSFFNDSVVPCNTCACGCDSNPRNTNNNVCSATEPALLLPAEALLVPFENRTRLAKTFADLKRREIPNPLPCGDNCGVSINWHLLSDFKDGWSARITLFNWGDTDIIDWFASVELDRVIPGFEKVYSMDGKVLPDSNNNTLFLQGLPGLNYLIAERNGSNPRKDPRVPGTQQSVISFTKKKTPAGINVARRDGFPTKVYFNGEECSLPTMLPSNARRKAAVSALFSTILTSILLILVLKQQ
ncbi:UNVERIFIED_CONTAM: COBRA-like protein 7 [Sesamum radiatum]|uniref:COBRA-like protein 7 n=1 Tax=Sesamum radiatum TaxID=300843 RepID=A0AAW2W740_SESRA